MRYRLASFAAAAALAGTAAVGITSSPASADAPACIDILQATGEYTLTRDVACHLGETVGDLVSPQAGQEACEVAMLVTFLPTPIGQAACAAAVL